MSLQEHPESPLTLSKELLAPTMPLEPPPKELVVGPPSYLSHQKLLLGPGPSNMAPRVAAIMCHEQILPISPEMTALQEEVKAGIRYAFQTNNQWTFVLSGSGHSGMESALCNCLERGERLLVASHGFWGERAEAMAKAHGIQVRTVSCPLGEVFIPPLSEQFEREFVDFRPHAMFVCHGDSSTGILQPLEGFAELCHRYGCLLIVDAVVSVGCAPIYMDAWGIDVMYAATQKCLSGPSGMSPISFSDRAINRIRARKTPVESYYLNAISLGTYWGCNPDDDSFMAKYHHTPPSGLLLGLRESLALLAEEGLESSWTRHQRCARMFRQGLKDIGLEVMTKTQDHRLPCLTMVKIPDDVECQEVIDMLVARFKIFVTGGLKVWSKQIWRIGFMGHNATPENVQQALRAFKETLDYCRIQSIKTSHKL